MAKSTQTDIIKPIDISDEDDYDIIETTKKLDVPKSAPKRVLKTQSGNSCLTKCYAPGQAFIHPVSLIAIHAIDKNICAVYPWYDSTKDKTIDHEPCETKKNVKYDIPDEKEAFLLRFFFDNANFLNRIYGLNNFDQVIEWTMNNIKDLPFDTIKRVHNCAWKAYVETFKDISLLVIEYYYQLACNNWMKDYVKHILTKFSFNVLSLISNESESNLDSNSNPNPNPNLDSNLDPEKLRNIVIKKYFSLNKFSNFLQAYADLYALRWNEIVSPYKHIKNFVYEKLIEEISSGI